MTWLISILGTRAGAAGAAILCGLLAAVAGGLGVSLWLARGDLEAARAELAAEQKRSAQLDLSLQLQNRAVRQLSIDAAFAQAAADQRATAALKPRTRPNLKTIQELNEWFSASPP